MPTAPDSAPVDRADEHVPLDRVMLAMDVVDTLRHHRQLVARELDEEAREREFVTRVQRIYDAQGIEVDEQVIAEAVQALREERFTYTPPPRSLQVRLAEVYVERGKWGLRALLLLLLAGVLYAGYAVPAHYHRQGLIDSFAQRISRTLEGAEELLRRCDRLDGELAALDGDRESWRAALHDGREHVVTARERLQLVLGVLRPGPDVGSYPDDRSRWDEVTAEQRRTVAAAEEELDAAQRTAADVAGLRQVQRDLAAVLQRGAAQQAGDDERARQLGLRDLVEQHLTAADNAAARAALIALDAAVDAAARARQQLAESRAELDRLRAMLAGVDVEPTAQRQREQLEQAAAAALAADDAARAGATLGQLRALLTALDRTYELRIVQRGQSGVWRYHTDDRRIRNYYIVVEAVDADGRPLRLQVESEEDGSTRSVSRFGVRVPKAVYEQVKADKLDNRIVDRRLFATKRRGRLEPEYHFDVAGGRITSW